MRLITFAELKDNQALFLALVMSTEELVGSEMSKPDRERYEALKTLKAKTEFDHHFRLRRMIVGCLGFRKWNHVFRLVENTEETIRQRFDGVTGDEDEVKMLQILKEAFTAHNLTFGMTIAPDVKHIYERYLEKTDNARFSLSPEAQIAILRGVMDERATPPAWSPPSEDFMSLYRSL